MDEKQHFINELNKRRKTGQWYSYVGTVNGKQVRVKGYKTWLQIFRIDGIDNSNCMDSSVRQFNEDLASSI